MNSRDTSCCSCASAVRGSSILRRNSALHRSAATPKGQKAAGLRCLLSPVSCLLSSARSAFSLVEVAVAVAVIAIGLLVVIGLFPQGLQSARNAADNTLSATIVQNMFGQLRNGDFIINICTDPSYPFYQCPSPVALNLSVSPGKQSFSFDQEGLLTNGPAYYQVNLQWVAMPVNLPWVVISPDLMLVQATVVWPAYLASPPPINTNIFITEVARYNKP